MGSMIALPDNIFGEPLLSVKPKVGGVFIDGHPGIRIWAPDLEFCNIHVFIQKNEATPFYCKPMHDEGNGYFIHIFEIKSESYEYALALPNGELIPDPYGHEMVSCIHSRSKYTPSEVLKGPGNDWGGVSNENLIIQELHIGAFTKEGTFSACTQKLVEIKKAGFSAIQLMPINLVPGKKNWGYDQVSFFCLNSQYGSIKDLRSLIEAAHELGMAVIYDAVFNHLGPEGNNHGKVASAIESRERETPWGTGLGLCDYYGPNIESLILNAVEYWVGNIGFDGIRLDAADHLCVSGDTTFLEKIFDTVKKSCRHENYISILEGDIGRINSSKLAKLRDKNPNLAIWNQSLLPSANDQTVNDYELDEMIACQNTVISIMARQEGVQFINFLRSHDTIGNANLTSRNQGNEKTKYLTFLPLLLLAPATPMIFMGDQWLADSPFHFFCDFHDITDQQLLTARNEEFNTDFSSCPPAMSDEAFLSSKLDWKKRSFCENAEVELFTRTLIEIRKKIISQLSVNGTDFNVSYDESRQDIVWENTIGDSLTIKIVGHEKITDSDMYTNNLIFENVSMVEKYNLPVSIFAYINNSRS